MTQIMQNVAGVRQRIEAAARAAGRNPQDITLLAAVKYASDETLREMENTDVDGFGENRVQQLLARWPDPAYRAKPLHFIGSLQTNKVKYVIDKVTMIHSLDSERLAAEIDRQAARIGRTVDVLAEINCGREADKGGLLPEDAADFCAGLSRYPHLRLCGFMTMAPKCPEKRDYIPYFTQTYNLSIDIWCKKLHNNIEPVLSMGMSDSFEEAIACGATMVRVGRGLFAPQPDAVS